MVKVALYGLWLFFYLLCGILGIMEPSTGLQAGAMTVLSLIFFLPPAILLIRAIRMGDQKTVRILRLISILSLSLTLVGFVVNIAAVNASEQAGLVLYRVLNFLSVPMVCSRHYVLSLFLWACLLFSTFPKFLSKKR